MKTKMCISLFLTFFLVLPGWGQDSGKLAKSDKKEEAKVVVSDGYKSTDKKNLTTSVSTIEGTNPKYKSYPNIYEMIRSQVSGVRVIGTSIQIMAPSSISGNDDPLFIVDGVPVESIDNISPGQVKSIDILNNNLSVSGGGESGKFFLSFNNLDQQGAVIETYNKRTTFRVNTLFNVSDKFRIGENLTGLSNVNPTIGSSQTSAIGYSFTQQPIIPVYDIAGNFAGPAGIGSGSNPVAVQLRSRNNRSENYRIFGNAFAELDFLNYFTLRSSIGGDFSANDTRDFVYPTYERAENIVASVLTNK